MDADGQHRVDDAKRVWEAAARNPKALILGRRRFEGEVPARSRFGNAATRFVYQLATGVPVTDTQTAFAPFTEICFPGCFPFPESAMSTK